jgi:hypothetical protein
MPCSSLWGWSMPLFNILFQTSVPWSFSNLYHYFLKFFTFTPCYFRELELHYILEWAHCIWKNGYCSQPWGLYLIRNYIFNWTITKYLNICKLWFFLLTCQFRSIWSRNIRLRSSHAFLFLKKQYINEQYIFYCDAPGFLAIINANDRNSRVKPANTGQS